MRRNTGYIKKKKAETNARLYNQLFSRAKTLDSVIIALGQLGCDYAFIAKFWNEFKKVESDINEYLAMDYLTSTEENHQRDGYSELQFAYSKTKIDEAIKQYVPAYIFVEFDYRYGLKDIQDIKEFKGND